MTYESVLPESKLIRRGTMLVAAAYALTTQPQQYSFDLIGLATTACYALEIEGMRQIGMYLGREISEVTQSKDLSKPYKDYSRLLGFMIAGAALLNPVLPLGKVVRDVNGSLGRHAISWTCNKVESLFNGAVESGASYHQHHKL